MRLAGTAGSTWFAFTRPACRAASPHPPAAAQVAQLLVEANQRIGPDVGELFPALKARRWAVGLVAAWCACELRCSYLQLLPPSPLTLLPACAPYPAPQGRMTDSNRNLAAKVLVLLGDIARAMGPPFDRAARPVLFPAVANLSDNKKQARREGGRGRQGR